MSGALRDRIHSKFSGRCAYCGDPITQKQMHIDHLKPIFRGWGDSHPFPEHGGTDTEDNMMPSCASCNIRKSTLSLEAFREEISLQLSRLRRDSTAFRLVERFGLIAETGKPVTFWFEKHKGAGGK